MSAVFTILSRRIHGEQGNAAQRAFYKYMASMMDVCMSSARHRLRHHVELSEKPLLEIKETCKILEQRNCKRELIVKNFEILSLSASVVKQRYAALKELGFAVVEVPEILRFSGVVSQSRDTLKSIIDISACEDDPIRCLLKNVHHLSIDNELKWRHQPCQYTATTPFQTVRLDLLADIIMQKLNMDCRCARRMLEMSVHLQLSAVANVAESLAILRDEFKMREQIKWHPVLLSVPPEDLTSLMETAEEFRIDVYEMAVERLLVLCTNPNLFRMSCGYLLDYGVRVDTITRCPEIFSIPPDDLLHGLQTLSVWPDFNLIRSEPQFLRFLAVYRQAEQRLKFLQKERRNCGFEYLLKGDKVFLTLMNRVFREENVCGEGVVAYLADKLGSTSEDVLTNLKDHPFFKESSISTVKSSLCYLLKQGFCKEVIIKGLALVLHPHHDIQTVIQELSSNDLVQPLCEWQQHENFLQLVLYVIERNKVASAPYDNLQIEVQELIGAPN